MRSTTATRLHLLRSRSLGLLCCDTASASQDSPPLPTPSNLLRSHCLPPSSSTGPLLCPLPPPPRGARSSSPLFFRSPGCWSIAPTPSLASVTWRATAATRLCASTLWPTPPAAGLLPLHSPPNPQLQPTTSPSSSRPPRAAARASSAAPRPTPSLRRATHHPAPSARPPAAPSHQASKADAFPSLAASLFQTSRVEICIFFFTVELNLIRDRWSSFPS